MPFLNRSSTHFSWIDVSTERVDIWIVVKKGFKRDTSVLSNLKADWTVCRDYCGSSTVRTRKSETDLLEKYE